MPENSIYLMPPVQLEHIQKSYGEIDAISDLSFTVSEGSIYGLLGPNGAGKTTTMEILTGQLVPDSGRVSVLGINPVQKPIAVREQVGILPETESPPSFMTPREYWSFVGTVRNVAEEILDERVSTWVERLSLENAVDSLSKDLSRGQQQKVMITAAFLHEPAVVFIDEPLSNLDPIMQERVKQAFVDFARDGGTILLSTHNVDVAAAICSRVGIVYNGELMREVDSQQLGNNSLLDVFVNTVDSSERASGFENPTIAGPDRQ